MRSFLATAAMLGLVACDAVVGPRVGDPSEQPSHASALAPIDLPAFFDCLRERSQTIVSAHRGGPGPGYPENALETYARTLAQTPAFVEADVQAARDGLVLLHDDDVGDLTDGHGAVSRLTVAQVQALRLKDDDGALTEFHPPSLRQALDWAEHRTVLELDIKRSVAYEDVIAAVRAANAMNRVVFVTNSVSAAARLADLAPEAMLYVTIETEGDLDELRRRGADLAHVVAWTGVDEPNSSLNVALAQAGVEARFGTLGGGNSWDARFARAHQDQYAVFADTGLAMIATDRPADAVRDLDANDGDESGYGALQCVSAQ